MAIRFPMRQPARMPAARGTIGRVVSLRGMPHAQFGRQAAPPSSVSEWRRSSNDGGWLRSSGGGSWLRSGG